MADQLDVFDTSEWCVYWGYVVAWDYAGYAGALLGECEVDDPEHEAATKAARSCNPSREDVRGTGLAWDTESGAKRALRAARAAIKALASERKGKPRGLSGPRPLLQRAGSLRRGGHP